jgi:hypothetical protein
MPRGVVLLQSEPVTTVPHVQSHVAAGEVGVALPS